MKKTCTQKNICLYYMLNPFYKQQKHWQMVMIQKHRQMVMITPQKVTMRLFGVKLSPCHTSFLCLSESKGMFTNLKMNSIFSKF